MEAVFPSIYIYLLTPSSTAHAQMVNQWKLELKRIILEVPVARSAGQSNADSGNEIVAISTRSNLVPRAFPLKKWVGREKVIFSRPTYILREKPCDEVALDCVVIRCLQVHENQGSHVGRKRGRNAEF